MSRSPKAPLLWLFSLLALILPAAAESILRSTSLNTCQDNSGFYATLFNVVYTPNNNSAYVDMAATSTIEGNVIFDISISAYGYTIIRRTINPCDAGLSGFCPMVAGHSQTPFNIPVSASAAGQIPQIAYTFPDLDAKVKVFINRTDGDAVGQSVACVEADISNGKTVDLAGVKWASAVVTGLALASSALMSGLGHANAASHVAANALSLAGYFQSQAIVGLVGVTLPPAARSWVQDFQWSLGIIKVDFMQTIFTWYQRATGGTPAELFSSLTTVSVEVQKRSLAFIEPGMNLYKRATAMLPKTVVEHVSKVMKRGNIMTSTGSYVVYGIQRVAFKAGIESTNLFMTGLIFFCFFTTMAALCVFAFKHLCELAVKLKWIKSNTFQDFRNGWRTILKGILFRMTLIGYAPISILCLWEFTQRDSAAEVVLAVCFFVGTTASLAWAAFKVIRIAKRSVALHKNPAYILFSDAHALNKWGFLYIQFRASAYYFIVPQLIYTLIKAIFIAFAQSAGYVQAIALILIEVAALIAATVLRPWMDKSTNSFNITICVVNFLNAIFLLIFTDIFNQPALFTGIVGVVLWILNAAVTLVLLIMLIVTTVIIFFTGNPDGRYQYMSDDRTSFMKSQSQLHGGAELDALAATARGDKEQFGRMDLDDGEDGSETTGSWRRRHAQQDSGGGGTDPSSVLLPNSTGNSTHRSSTHRSSYLEPQPASPVDAIHPSAPMLEKGGRENDDSEEPAAAAAHGRQDNASPWQRGAGYD